MKEGREVKRDRHDSILFVAIHISVSMNLFSSFLSFVLDIRIHKTKRHAIRMRSKKAKARGV